jgi:hypothetical protein
MYEAELPLLASLFAGVRPKSDWAERWEFWNLALSRHGLGPAEFSASRPALRDAVETVYGKFASRKNARIWGEKSPNYWDRMDRVAKQFPAARFIVIFRDPRAVCRSVIEAAPEAPYFARPGMPLRALFACEYLKRQSDGLLNAGVPVHVLQYEDLVQQPEKELGAICDFLGVPFDPRMVSLGTADRRGFYEGAHHSLAKGDRIVSARSRDDLVPPAFKAKIDSYMNLWREKYNGAWPVYPDPLPVASKPASSQRLWDALHLRVLRRFDDFTAAVYCWAPIGLLRKYRKSKNGAPSAPDKESTVQEQTRV